MVEVGMLKTSPLHDTVAAVSVGIVDGEILLDLPYAEDSRAEVDMNVVQLGSGGLVEVQGTGESGTFDRKLLDRMLDLAEHGIAELARLQSRVLGA
jgi:ribonuclease PH